MALPFEVPRELFPVEHRFVTLNGARIHYIDEAGYAVFFAFSLAVNSCFIRAGPARHRQSRKESNLAI